MVSKKASTGAQKEFTNIFRVIKDNVDSADRDGLRSTAFSQVPYISSCCAVLLHRHAVSSCFIWKVLHHIPSH